MTDPTLPAKLRTEANLLEREVGALEVTALLREGADRIEALEAQASKLDDALAAASETVRLFIEQAKQMREQKKRDDDLIESLTLLLKLAARQAETKPQEGPNAG